MNYRDKIKSLLVESESALFLELYNATNYMHFQMTKVLPIVAKMHNMTANEFALTPEGYSFMAAFKKIAIETFGQDEHKRPNTDIEADPRWNIKHPESDTLAKELLTKMGYAVDQQPKKMGASGGM